MSETNQPTSPGWYHSPNDPDDLQRWWTGASWSEYTQTPAGMVAASGDGQPNTGPKTGMVSGWANSGQSTASRATAHNTEINSESNPVRGSVHGAGVLSDAGNSAVDGESRNTGAAGWLTMPFVTIFTAAIVLYYLGAGVFEITTLGVRAERGAAAYGGAAALLALSLAGFLIISFATLSYFMGTNRPHPVAREHLIGGLNYSATALAVIGYWQISRLSMTMSIALTIAASALLALTVLYRNARTEAHPAYGWAWMALIVIVGVTSRYGGMVNILAALAAAGIAIALPAFNFVRARMGTPANLAGFPSVPFLSER